MRAIWFVFCVLILATGVFGCAEDETTIFVEHAKEPPSPPDCKSNTKDAEISSGLLDLSFRNPYGTVFLLNTHSVPPDDWDRPSGIIIDGMEVFVQTSGGEGVGLTEYFEFKQYIPQGVRHIATGMAISPTIAATLADRFDCLPLNDTNYPPGSMGWDRRGEQVPRYLGFVYSQVVFLGHTLSQDLHETPEFAFPVQLCCGCLVNWLYCMNECSRHCVIPVEHGFCTPGVANGGIIYDCRSLYHDPDYSPSPDLEPGVYCDTCDPGVVGRINAILPSLLL
jgi:hypothetical protein